MYHKCSVLDLITVYFCGFFGWWAIICHLPYQLFKLSHCEFSLLSKNTVKGCSCQKKCIVFLYNTKVLCKKWIPGHCCLLTCKCFSALEFSALIILLALLWKSAVVFFSPPELEFGNEMLLKNALNLLLDFLRWRGGWNQQEWHYIIGIWFNFDKASYKGFWTNSR